MAREPNDGPIGRIAETISWFLTLALGQVLLLLPGAAGSLFLARDASNLPLAWALYLPAGPALASGLSALRARVRNDDRGPLSSFLRGLRQNWWDALRVWGLGTGFVALLLFNSASADRIGLPDAYLAFAAVTTVLALSWTLLCLVVTTTAAFRFRDVLRLGTHYMFTRPLVSLGVIGVVLASAAAVALTFDAVLLLFTWLLTLALDTVARPVVADLRNTFVHKHDDETH